MITRSHRILGAGHSCLWTQSPSATPPLPSLASPSSLSSARCSRASGLPLCACSKPALSEIYHRRGSVLCAYCCHSLTSILSLSEKSAASILSANQQNTLWEHIPTSKTSVIYWICSSACPCKPASC